MSNFDKDKSLTNGRGEEDVQWITVNGAHVPIQPGQNKKQAVKDKFTEQSYEEKIEAIKPLINTLKQIKKIKTKELWGYIKSLKPVKLSINDEEIVAEFDKFTANKNIFGHGKSDTEGYNYKISNLTQIPNLVGSSRYSHSQKEQGKASPQHKGVKQWHYFTNKIQTEKGEFNVVVNVRDKGNNQFVYEIAIKKKKT